MGRKPNDGRGRLGGRAKGTPNKKKPTTTGWVDRAMAQTRPTIETVLQAQADGALYPRLLAALVVADAVNNLTATLRGIAAASGVNLEPDNTNAVKTPTGEVNQQAAV